MRRDGDEFDATNGTPVDVRTLMMRPGPPFSWHDVEQGLTDRTIGQRRPKTKQLIAVFAVKPPKTVGGEVHLKHGRPLPVGRASCLSVAIVRLGTPYTR
jgi:hypothetical protein